MKRALLSLLVLLTLVFFGATLALAQEAEKPAEAKGSEQAAPAEKKAPAVKAETISGTISMVETEKKLLVLVASSGVPFNFKVTGATRIKIAGKKAKLADLAAQTNKSAAVKFLPSRSGNVAQTIEVSE